MADLSRSVKQPFRAPKVKRVSASATLTPQDSGKTIAITSTTATTLTLPKVASKQMDGVTFHFTVLALAASSDHRVTPASGDSILYAAAGASVTAGQSMVCSNATDQIGAGFEVIADYASGGWVVRGVTGTWAKA